MDKVPIATGPVHIYVVFEVIGGGGGGGERYIIQ